jgi:hypothetical protein
MLKTAGAAAALALGTLTAVPVVLARSIGPSAAVTAPLTRDLGVPSKPQTGPARIISTDAGRATMRLAASRV